MAQTIILLFSLLQLATIAAGYGLPSTNIFNPLWLNQRRARTFGSPAAAAAEAAPPVLTPGGISGSSGYYVHTAPAPPSPPPPPPPPPPSSAYIGSDGRKYWSTTMIGQPSGYFVSAAHTYAPMLTPIEWSITAAAIPSSYAYTNTIAYRDSYYPAESTTGYVSGSSSASSDSTFAKRYDTPANAAVETTAETQPSEISKSNPKSDAKYLAGAKPAISQAGVMIMAPCERSPSHQHRAQSGKNQPEMNAHAHRTPTIHTIASHHYPVYVLPPKNFQPIVYHAPIRMYHTIATAANPNTKSNNELMWYDANNGASLPVNARKITRYGAKPYGPNEIEHDRKKITYSYGEDGVIAASGSDRFPVVYEAASASANSVKLDANPYSNNQNIYNTENEPIESTATLDATISGPTPVDDDRRQTRPTLKTKLPVGLSSFFLGGVRGVSARYWKLPADIIRDLEFMPNADPMSPENKYLPESTYVKKVTTEADDSSPPQSGDREKEDSQQQQQQQQSVKSPTNGLFENNNAIIDSAIDLEATESRNVEMGPISSNNNNNNNNKAKTTIATNATTATGIKIRQ